MKIPWAMELEGQSYWMDDSQLRDFVNRRIQVGRGKSLGVMQYRAVSFISISEAHSDRGRLRSEALDFFEEKKISMSSRQCDKNSKFVTIKVVDPPYLLQLYIRSSQN